MWLAIQNYPTSRQITIGPAGEGATNASAQHSEGDVSMEVETGSAASSTTRRPKAKARPHQPTVMANVIIIRYDILATLEQMLQTEEESILYAESILKKLGRQVRTQWAN